MIMCEYINTNGHWQLCISFHFQFRALWSMEFRFGLRPGPWLNVKVHNATATAHKTHPNMPRAAAYTPASRTAAWRCPVSPL